MNDHMSVNVHGATDLDATLRDVLARLDLTDVTHGERRSCPADKVTGPFETLDANGRIGDLHVTVTVFTRGAS